MLSLASPTTLDSSVFCFYHIYSHIKTKGQKLALDTIRLIGNYSLKENENFVVSQLHIWNYHIYPWSWTVLNNLQHLLPITLPKSKCLDFRGLILQSKRLCLDALFCVLGCVGGGGVSAVPFCWGRVNCALSFMFLKLLYMLSLLTVNCMVCG